MAQQYYFFRTVKIGGRQRLRPLPGQKEPSGRHIDESLNVQADSRMREDYPLGTIFGSESLELRSLHSTTFYSAGAIYPIGLNLGDYHSQSHMPSAGMNEAYDSYKADLEEKARPVLSEESTLFTESGNATTPGSMLSQLKADRKMNAPTIEGEGFHIADKDWYLLVRNIKSKVNTMMVGPSGTGKTELVLLACKKLGLECSVYDMGSMYDPVSGLLGVHRLQKGGESVFDYAKFTQDIQKPGVILLDELSRAPVTTNNILFPCLDSRRMLAVEIPYGQSHIGDVLRICRSDSASLREDLHLTLQRHVVKLQREESSNKGSIHRHRTCVLGSDIGSRDEHAVRMYWNRSEFIPSGHLNGKHPS